MGKCQVPQYQQNSGSLPQLRKVPLFRRASKEESTPRVWKTHVRPQTSNEQVRPTKLLIEHPHHSHSLHASPWLCN